MSVQSDPFEAAHRLARRYVEDGLSFWDAIANPREVFRSSVAQEVLQLEALRAGPPHVRPAKGHLTRSPVGAAGRGLVNVTVTVVAAVTVTVQGPVPLQPPPLQPPKMDPAAGVAVSVTAVPLA